MKVLGPAIIDARQQRALETGTASLLITRDRVFQDAAQRARSGDIWWVKEPTIEVTSPKYGCPTTHEFLPGSVIGVTIPDRLKPYWEILEKKPATAGALHRGESRTTLVIQEIRPSGFLCTVHMKNVDEFLKRSA